MSQEIGALVSVVDEDPWTVRSVSSVLKDLGFRVVGMSRFELAAIVLIERRVDVVVIGDRSKSGVSADAVCARIAEQLGAARPGFVLHTRSAEDAAVMGESRFDAVMEKPMKVAELAAAIETALASRPAGRTAFRPPSAPATGARWLNAAGRRN